jgi:hypothetical protein
MSNSAGSEQTHAPFRGFDAPLRILEDAGQAFEVLVFRIGNDVEVLGPRM